MGRKRHSTMDDLAALPWPLGIVVGIAGYFLIRYGVPALLARGGGPLAQGLAQQPGLLASFAWMVLALCMLAAAASFFSERRSRRLLDAQTGLDQKKWCQKKWCQGQLARKNDVRDN